MNSLLVLTVLGSSFVGLACGSSRQMAGLGWKGRDGLRHVVVGLLVKGLLRSPVAVHSLRG